MVLDDQLDGVDITARIIGSPTFLCGDTLRCELIVNYCLSPAHPAQNNITPRI